MANHKSSIKRARQTVVRTERNRAEKSRMKTLRKKALTAIASGDACIIKSTADIAEFRDGSILVTERTDPDWMPIMKRASGIVTEHGGTTSHAAIVSRELGLPAVVGA